LKERENLLKYLGRQIEYGAVLLFISIYFGVCFPPDIYFQNASTPLQASDPFATTVNTALIVFLLIGVSVHFKQILKITWNGQYIFFLIALTFISTLWSIDPAVTFRRAGTLLVSTGLAVYLCARFDFPALIQLFTRVNLIIVAASFIIGLVSPRLVMSAWGDSAWRGALIGKNQLGEAAALGIVISTCSLIIGANSRALAVGTLLGNVILLALSKSVTGGLETVVGVMAAGGGWLLRSRGPQRQVFFLLSVVIALCVLAAMAIVPREVLAALGRNETLTGRSALWSAVYHEMQYRPVLGYGYSAFWSNTGTGTLRIWSIIPWHPPNSHNSWLEIALQLGLLGVAANAIAWINLLRRCASILNAGENHGVIFWLVIAMCLLTSSVSEIVMLRPGGYLWILFVMAYIEVARQAGLVRRPIERTLQRA
jgi:exopolysaccharide production protein ExoQ